MAQALDFSSVGAIPATPPPAAPKQGALDFSHLGAIPAQPAAVAPDDSAASLAELSAANPNKEGLYHMKDSSGKAYQVPFSNVESVDDWRNNFVDEKEAQRYEKDYKASEPDWRDKLLSHTGPISEEKRHTIRAQAEILPDWVKQRPKSEQDSYLKMMRNNAEDQIDRQDFGRGIANGAGTLVLHPVQSVNQFLDLINDSGYAAEAGLHIHDWGHAEDVRQGAERFHKVVDELKKQYKTNSAYFIGQMIGQALAAKGASEVAGKTFKAVKAAPEAVRAGAREVVGIRPKTAADMVDATMEKNAAATEAASARNAKAASEHLEKTREALHETEGKELEHEAATRAVEEKNQAAREAHAKAVESVNAHNQEIADANRELAETKAKIAPKSAPSRFRVIQDSAKSYFNKQYNRLSELIGERKAPLEELVEGVENARAKLQGSDTKIAVFDDIEKRAKGEVAASDHLPENWHEMSPDEQSAFLKERSKLGGQISFEDLRGYYRELGRVIGSEATPADVKQAAVEARKVLDKMQSDLADKSGLKAKALYRRLSRQYKNYAETMLDRTGPNASPTAKAAFIQDNADAALAHFEGMDTTERSRAFDLLTGRNSMYSEWLKGEETPLAKRTKFGVEVKRGDGWEPVAETFDTREDAEKAAAKLDGETPARVKDPDPTARVGASEKLRTMRQYRLDTEKLIREYLDLKAKRARLGKVQELPEHPEMEEPPAPKPRTAPPDRPEEVQPDLTQVGEEELTEANRKQYSKTIQTLRNRGIWYGAALPWIWVAHDLIQLNFSKAALNSIGAAMSSVATIAGLTKLADILEQPAVRDWVSKPSFAEMRQLNRLPPEQRKVIADGFRKINIVAAKEKIPVSPFIKDFMRENKNAVEPAASRVEKVVVPANAERGVEEVKLPVEEAPKTEKTQYDFSSTQHDIPADSEAAKAISGVREKIAPEDIVETGQGNDAGEEPHVTLRYGIKGDEFDGIKKYLEKQAPFEAKLGKVTSFAPSPSSHGAAPLIVDVTSPDFKRMNTEIAQHGDFIPPTFAEYKPHATIAYVKPEAAAKYVGDTATEGKTFKVDEISISDRNGNRHVVKLKGEPPPAPKTEPPPTPPASPGHAGPPLRRLEDLNVDPQRFQYKLGGNKAGVTDPMDVEWDQSLADPIHTWVDPEDGKEYVVNGHHRYDLAKQAGSEHIQVNPLDNAIIKTAQEARQFGALKNLADGNGTSVDAAKFFRDSGLTPADLKKYHVSLKKSVVNEGMGLSRLKSDEMFNAVIDGRLDPKIGSAIGEASDSEADQEAILKDVRRQEKNGVKVTADQIRESARLIKQAPSFKESTQDLFGEHNEERSLFMEMGEISDYIRKQLAAEKRTFGSVADKGKAETLAKGGNVISPEKNAEIAQRAAQQRELYDKRSAQAGPIHAALTEAAEKLAEGGDANAIKRAAYEEVREHLAEELGETH